MYSKSLYKSAPTSGNCQRREAQRYLTNGAPRRENRCGKKNERLTNTMSFTHILNICFGNFMFSFCLNSSLSSTLRLIFANHPPSPSPSLPSPLTLTLGAWPMLLCYLIYPRLRGKLRWDEVQRHASHIDLLSTFTTRVGHGPDLDTRVTPAPCFKCTTHSRDMERIYIVADKWGGVVRKYIVRGRWDSIHNATQHLVADWQVSNPVHVPTRLYPTQGLEHATLLNSYAMKNVFFKWTLGDILTAILSNVLMVECKSPKVLTLDAVVWQINVS